MDRVAYRGLGVRNGSVSAQPARDRYVLAMDRAMAKWPYTRRKWIPLPRPKRAFGRSLPDFGALEPAEKELLKSAAKGDTHQIGGNTPDKVEGVNIARGYQPPTEGTDANTVRGEFIRFLLLGGDDEHAVHERRARLSVTSKYKAGGCGIMQTSVTPIAPAPLCGGQT